MPALKEDLSKLSHGPTATSWNDADRRLDFTPLSDYLAQRAAGPLIRAVLDVAYTIEFGRETSRQSALAMLFFIAANSDLANHQNTWETSPSLALNGSRGVLTDYSGGERGARLAPAKLQAEAGAFLDDLDRVYPGRAVLARREKGRVQAHLENGSKLPLFKGAYRNNPPGYFTTLEGLYARPAGNIHFAGEHTDSFYNYQGFMEGALLSGARAADEVLRGL